MQTLYEHSTGQKAEPRRRNDFYETPPSAVRPFVEGLTKWVDIYNGSPRTVHAARLIGSDVWEPAYGAGALADEWVKAVDKAFILPRYAPRPTRVYRSDIDPKTDDGFVFDYLSGDVKACLKAHEASKHYSPYFAFPFNRVITNPPYNKAHEFIEAYMLYEKHTRPMASPSILALLLKSTFFHKRRSMKLPLPNLVMPLRQRPDFTGKGSPYMDCSWFVWLPDMGLAPFAAEYVPLEPDETP